MSSRRLPNKALELLDDKSLIKHVISRAKKIDNITNLIIATSNNNLDDSLVNHIEKIDIDIFRGSLEDVTLRAYNCCKKYSLDAFVRICGDRPFFDPDETNKAIEIFKYNKKYQIVDLLTNTNRNVAPGLKIEIISSKALKKVLECTKSLDDREHLTKYIYNNPNKFNISHLVRPPYNDEKNRYVIDDNIDLERTKYILKNIDLSNTFNMEEIIKITDEWQNKIKN